ncbi:hypothetical protein [Mangrovibrevibacter kandeliae]|uniref:hypothetical protein n=1 Tax=Mangrovibrevibacter kandeliae TaxID=2968473 RepID=UPI0021189768|nr:MULTISPECIES: hypothetical protein [unclassified Aurantimonas]MCQ8783588.1 hypothetical protein [Aurantimonas sp. CSK15Z-1]MCW4116452.1 hypothetical protein [Aurantimonas sp. MSK8Z-1]
MSRSLDAAIDQMGERVTEICEFLHDIQPGQPVDVDALKDAMHDCANVTASMQSLKRVVNRIEERAAPRGDIVPKMGPADTAD